MFKDAIAGSAISIVAECALGQRLARKAEKQSLKAAGHPLEVDEGRHHRDQTGPGDH